MINLFGEEQSDIDATKSNGFYKKKKTELHLRMTNYCVNENCKHCVFRITFNYHNKNYHKCKLIGISHSTATDIRLSNVCDKFNAL